MKMHAPVGIALAVFVLAAGYILAFGLLEPVRTDSSLVKTSPVKDLSNQVTVVSPPEKKVEIQTGDGALKVIPTETEAESEDNAFPTSEVSAPPAPEVITPPAPEVTVPPAPTPAPQPVTVVPDIPQPAPLPPQPVYRPRRTRAS